MQYGLSDSTIEKIRGVLSAFGKIDKAILFGSRAKGTYKPGSDIDLAVFGNNIGLEEHNSLANLLDDLLLPYKIDVIVYTRINSEALKVHIARAGKLFFTTHHEHTTA